MWLHELRHDWLHGLDGDGVVAVVVLGQTGNDQNGVTMMRSLLQFWDMIGKDQNGVTMVRPLLQFWNIL